MRDNWFLYLIAVLLGGGIAGGLFFFNEDGTDAEVPFVEAAATTDEIIPLELTPVSEPQETAALESEPVVEDTAAEDAARAEALAATEEAARVEAEEARLLAEAEAAAQAEEDARVVAEAAAKAEEEARMLAEAEATARAEEEARVVAEAAAKAAEEARLLAEAEAAAKAAEEARLLAEAEAAAQAVEEARVLAEAEAAAEDARILAEAAAKAKEEARALAEAEEARLLAEAQQAEIDAENATASTSDSQVTETLSEPQTATADESEASEKTTEMTTVTGTTLTIEGEKPEFDVVRVDQSGTAVIAGTAMPNSTVSIMSDGEKIGEATANSSGEFVAILSTNNAETQNLDLESELDGQLAFSDESILILPNIGREAAESVDEDVSPTIVKATPDAVVVIQSGGPELVEQIIIDSISYDEEGGQVFISGRGSPENEVFLYVNNTPVANTMIDASGQWMIQLKDIEVGIYTMRADELSPEGDVISRMETPFQRAYPSDVQDAQATSSPTHVVQPGNSLWLIATNNYGDGLKYHQIFQANIDKIRDPDLIYPGQVFVIPQDE